MTKTLNTTFAAALVAASVFGGSAALAAGKGDYYPGVANEQAQSQSVDTIRTHSIGNRVVIANETASNVGPANGDYYQGVNRDAR
ncbi:hypothetical protein [Shinella zoogloeoides]|jgi:hypothetical protein|uniref:hypothetical protein n=1 Tax=Shinella zoogloeoides TaxID=352475 RepID=UPI00273DA3B9|nr:hypothetical protein [Shinella zoogloeoides]WLR93025.1 hypothetical protein Q9316_02090 [Shinella zoogloeoides]